MVENSSTGTTCQRFLNTNFLTQRFDVAPNALPRKTLKNNLNSSRDGVHLKQNSERRFFDQTVFPYALIL
jgi:hypothetical protein